MTHTRRLGRKELNLVDTKHGEDGYGEENDTQTTKPLGEAAPKKQGMGLTLYVVEDGGSRSGKARHRLKEGIGKTGNVTSQPIRQTAEKGKSGPANGDGDVAVAAGEITLATLACYTKPQTHQEGRKR